MTEMVGRIVKSKAGRDKGRLFVVIQVVDDKFVLIVDGDLRRIDKPKKKKIKHLQVYNKFLSEFIKKWENKSPNLNSELQKMLISVANEND